MSELLESEYWEVELENVPEHFRENSDFFPDGQGTFSFDYEDTSYDAVVRETDSGYALALPQEYLEEVIETREPLWKLGGRTNLESNEEWLDGRWAGKISKAEGSMDIEAKSEPVSLVADGGDEQYVSGKEPETLGDIRIDRGTYTLVEGIQRSLERGEF